MQRRIERADDHRESVHGFEQAGEIRALHGQKLGQRLAAVLFVVAPGSWPARTADGLRRRTCARCGTGRCLRRRMRRGLGIARNIGIGAHAEFAAELVGHLHELAEDRRIRDRGPAWLPGPGRLRPWCRSIEIQSPCLTVTVLPPTFTVAVLRASLMAMRRAADHAGPPMPRATTAACESCRRSRSGCPSRRPCRGCRRAWFPCGPGSPARRRDISTASSAVNATPPTAAPGEAAMPVVSLVSVFRLAASKTGCSN